jgi:predicted permease
MAPIALGIGINTGLFSLLDAIALQPVPAPEPTELVNVYQDFQGVRERRVHGARAMFSLPEFEQYRRAARTVSGVLAYSQPSTATLGGDAPRQVDGAFVSCNYFDVLHVRPALGPGFTAANCDASDAPPVVVITHDLWRRGFDADRAVTGRTITLNGREFAVAGVAPAGFAGIDMVKASFFVPIAMQPVLQPRENYYRDPAMSWLMLVARRAPTATNADARTELTVIAGAIDREQPGRTTTLSVTPARALSIPQARKDIFSVAAVVLAAFGLVLLIACANVANLLLARGAARSKEIAVRQSLGVTRGRLIRQLLTESMSIAVAGAAAGTVLARWSFHTLLAVLMSSLPANVPPLSIDTGTGLNANVLWFALALTVITGLAFGLAPALQTSRLDIQALLNRDTAGAGRRSSGWLRGSLVGIQAAVCTVLLASAILLLRCVYVTETIEPGFEYRNVAVVSFDPRGAGYDAARGSAFQRNLIERLRSLPGVDGIARAGRTPLSPGRSQTSVRVSDRAEWQEIDFTTVSPEYFQVLGVPITRGRTFAPAERDDRPREAIVSEATARRFWPGEDPIGRTILMALDRDAQARLEVVGVARDAQMSRMGQADETYLYLPAGHSSPDGLLVHSQTAFAALGPEIRRAARELEPALVVTVNPLDDNLNFWRIVSRLNAAVAGSLSVLAVLMASLGIYGVVAYVVARRVREIGIRMILGASAASVRRMILWQTLRPVVVGLVVGIAGAAAASQILQSVLFGVSAFDPLAFVGAPLLLLAVAAAASLSPARRVLSRDPMTALRYE